MLKTFRLLAAVIMVLVGVQAASHAWGSAGFGAYIAGGAVVDKSFMENTGGPLPFPEVVGLLIHGMNGGLVIPVVALGLLVVSFFTKAPGAIRWAAIVLGLVALQVSLGYAGHGLPILGLIHGANALVLFWAALTARRTAAGAAAHGSARPADRVSTPAEV